MPLVSLDQVCIAFGHLPLLDAAVLQLERGERVSVVGRNGAGKSTLLRILSGEVVPDSGSVWRAPGLRTARLEQDVPFSSDRTVFDVVSDGLGAVSDLVAEYHRTTVSLSRESSPALVARWPRRRGSRRASSGNGPSRSSCHFEKSSSGACRSRDRLASAALLWRCSRLSEL